MTKYIMNALFLDSDINAQSRFVLYCICVFIAMHYSSLIRNGRFQADKMRLYQCYEYFHEREYHSVSLFIWLPI